MIYVTGEKLTEVVAVGTPIDHPFYKKNQYNNPFIDITFFSRLPVEILAGLPFTGGRLPRCGKELIIRAPLWTACTGELPQQQGATLRGRRSLFDSPSIDAQSS